MPDLNKLPVPRYDPGHPYHADYDNLPLDVLKLRDEIMNGELGTHGQILREANGNQGTLSNRLNQSIDGDGSLKTEAVDAALHNIAEHTDGSKTVGTDELSYYVDSLGYSSVSNPVPFVRMLQSEREKLALIASEATNLSIEVETPSNIVLFEDGIVHFAPSTGITWEVSEGNVIQAVLGVSTEFAHRHFYDLEPLTDDYIEFTVTSVNTPYVEDSLRVYVNGVRLSSEIEIYTPGNLVSDDWVLLKFTPDHENGAFSLNAAITSEDIIRIDFDVALD